MAANGIAKGRDLTIYHQTGVHIATKKNDIEPLFEFLGDIAKATSKTGEIDLGALESYVDKPRKIIFQALGYLEEKGILSVVNQNNAFITSHGNDLLKVGLTLEKCKDLEIAGLAVINDLLKKDTRRDLFGDVITKQDEAYTGVHSPRVPVAFDKELKDRNFAVVIGNNGVPYIARVDGKRARIKIDEKVIKKFELYGINFQDLVIADHSKSCCPDCGSKENYSNPKTKELICNGCGLVIEDSFIDEGPEWRAFDQEQRESRTRVGAPRSQRIHDYGLSTVIDWRNRDAHNKQISPEMNALFYRLRKWQTRTRIQKPGDRSLATGLSDLDKYSSIIEGGMPDYAIDEAAVLFRQYHKGGHLRGRNIESGALGALYASCRMLKVARPLGAFEKLDDAVTNPGKGKAKMRRTYAHIKKSLGLRVPLSSPYEFIPLLSSNLEKNSGKKIPLQTQQRALDILRDGMELRIQFGRNPVIFATGALYIASKLDYIEITQREAADAADITEVSIRNTYKKIADGLGIKINV